VAVEATYEKLLEDVRVKLNKVILLKFAFVNNYRYYWPTDWLMMLLLMMTMILHVLFWSHTNRINIMRPIFLKCHFLHLNASFSVRNSRNSIFLKNNKMLSYLRETALQGAL